MQVHTFRAETASEAVQQIREKLGAGAVVINVRKLPVHGLARIWKQPCIEVLATLPEPPPSPPQSERGIAEPSKPIPSAEIKDTASLESRAQSELVAKEAHSDTEALYGGWRGGRLLERSGLTPLNVKRVIDRARADAGERIPATLGEELRVLRESMLRMWPAPASKHSNLHVFIGPPGVGKSTVLSKWLARSVLVEGRRARVWRWDGHVANTAEGLSVLAEILGVPVERCRPATEPPDASETVYVDLPGVMPGDTAAMAQLSAELASLENPLVHLVLNAAYEGQLLLEQSRAFAGLGVHDVILAHLDEEPRRGKIWNLALGTNYSVSQLSAGQNVPGVLEPAEPGKLLPV